MGLDIQSENWGEQLNALLAPKITASATKDVSFDQTIRLHTGYEADDVFEFDLNDNRTISLGVADINIATSVDKGSQIEKIDAALEKVSTQLATFGAYINRLNLKEANNETSITTTTKSVSKLVDADMAQEMSLLVKTNVLQQAIVASMQQMQKSFSQSMQTLLTK